VHFDNGLSGWVVASYLSAISSPSSPAVGEAPNAITNTLAKTWTGPEVSVLQTVLKKLGYLNASVTGYFGDATAAAVVKFQQDHSLSPVGVVGPLTRDILNTLLGK
jgi:peptidoglycan hydrolase-like protein with peptidoglycan-binding domain